MSPNTVTRKQAWGLAAEARRGGLRMLLVATEAGSWVHSRESRCGTESETNSRRLSCLTPPPFPTDPGPREGRGTGSHCLPPLGLAA